MAHPMTGLVPKQLKNSPETVAKTDCFRGLPKQSRNSPSRHNPKQLKNNAKQVRHNARNSVRNSDTKPYGLGQTVSPPPARSIRTVPAARIPTPLRRGCACVVTLPPCPHNPTPRDHVPPSTSHTGSERRPAAPLDITTSIATIRTVPTLDHHQPVNRLSPCHRSAGQHDESTGRQRAGIDLIMPDSVLRSAQLDKMKHPTAANATDPVRVKCDRKGRPDRPGDSRIRQICWPAPDCPPAVDRTSDLPTGPAIDVANTMPTRQRRHAATDVFAGISVVRPHDGKSRKRTFRRLDCHTLRTELVERGARPREARRHRWRPGAMRSAAGIPFLLEKPVIKGGAYGGIPAIARPLDNRYPPPISRPFSRDFSSGYPKSGRPDPADFSGGGRP